MLRGCSWARRIHHTPVLGRLTGQAGKALVQPGLPSPFLRRKPRRTSSYVAVCDVRFPVLARNFKDTCKICMQTDLQKHDATLHVRKLLWAAVFLFWCELSCFCSFECRVRTLSLHVSVIAPVPVYVCGSVFVIFRSGRYGLMRCRPAVRVFSEG